MDSSGLVQIIYGDGAGKTTMALGKAVRAHGAGLKVAVIQFMKPGVAWWVDGSPEVSELVSLEELGISVFSYGREEFVQDITYEDNRLARDALDKAMDFAQEVDLLILDEVLNAISYGVIDEDAVIEIISIREETELVLTGRKITDSIKKTAHQVVQVLHEKHPYEDGINARRGFEY